MKTVKVKIYTISELKKKFPEGFEYAHEKWIEQTNEDGIFWQDDIMASLKEVFKQTNDVKLTNWEISTHSGSQVWFDMDENVRELSGQRAIAWLENNLFYKLRENKSFQNRVKYYSGKPHNYTHYGKMKDCPLTGYCADEDFLDELVNSINKENCTLEEAYSNLAYRAEKLIESEYCDQISEEYFIDHATANGYEYTSEGKMY